ncbi:DNA replication and repair protein RecF [mine drainage metagenome]|uniref:DNA replication and repair protein RecF n=1 Tax=mine drainage metagenome TaxID=410659 RepID=A0A1J5SKT5_9ZZZZ
MSVAVHRLTLSDFRCYAFLRMETDGRPVVLTGANGAGKTNILEALSFLAPGRGLRRAKLSDIARHGSGDGTPWAVAAQLTQAGDPLEIGTGREAGSERRLVRIDGRAARSQAMLGQVLSVLWLTPAMDRLFLEGATGRRRFLDRLVLAFDPEHAARASAYERAMRDRSRLLREGRFDPSWLTVLEEGMARHGAAMAQARLETVERLNAACRQGIGPFPAAVLSVTGWAEQTLAGLDEAEAAAAMQAMLAGARRRDAEAGAALDGPHRSDLQVRHGAKNLPAEQCSTGEQKAVLVAIILGQARARAALRGAAPILLLDEVAAHLDQTRRAALFDELCALPAQSWLTGTDQSLFAEMGGRAQFFRVDDAVVQAA